MLRIIVKQDQNETCANKKKPKRDKTSIKQ
jgi:hypothetical protein